jgi:hypothetical protein
MSGRRDTAARRRLDAVVDGSPSWRLQLQWLRDPTIDFRQQWELLADRFFADAADPIR